MDLFVIVGASLTLYRRNVLRASPAYRSSRTRQRKTDYRIGFTWSKRFLDGLHRSATAAERVAYMI